MCTAWAASSACLLAVKLRACCNPASPSATLMLSSYSRGVNQQGQESRHQGLGAVSNTQHQNNSTIGSLKWSDQISGMSSVKCGITEVTFKDNRNKLSGLEANQ